MEINEVSKQVIGLAMKVHTHLGPGLIESVYKECLYYELVKNGFQVEKEKPIPLVYEEINLDTGYRLDLLVNGQLVIEIKSVEAITDVHWAQTLTYIKLGNFNLGLLINFNVYRLKNGIKRLVNHLPESLDDEIIK
jgi:GxxExxY protein